MAVPHGIMYFTSAAEYSECFAFCFGRNLNAVEDSVMNCPCLIFFSDVELNECISYCNLFGLRSHVVMKRC